VCGFWLMRNNFRVFVPMFFVLLVRWRFGRYRPPYRYATVLGQKDSSDAHFTPKVADFATLP